MDSGDSLRSCFEREELGVVFEVQYGEGPQRSVAQLQRGTHTSLKDKMPQEQNICCWKRSLYTV